MTNRALVLGLVLLGCGDDSGGGAADAPTAPDARPMADGGVADAPATPDGPTTDALPSDGGIDAVPVAGDTCALAIAASLGTTTGHTTVGFNHDYDSLACIGFTQAGPDRVYSVAVPAGMVLNATVSPDESFDISLALVGALADCTAPEPTCVDFTDLGGVGVAETVQFRNAGAVEQTVYVIVGSSSTTGNTYTLDLATVVAPAIGDQCSAPEVIVTPGTLTAHSTDGFTDDYNDPDGSCTTYRETGPDRVYSITVPGLNRLAATMTPASSDMGLYLITPLASCTANPTCVAGDDAGGMGAPEDVTYLNATNTPEEVFVVVDSYYPIAGTYDLTTAVTPLSAGELCANAIPIVAAGTVTGASGESGEYSPETSCTGYSVFGVDRVYSAIIPAGATLTATVTPVEVGRDPALYLVPMGGCMAVPTCLVGSDGIDADPAETVTYMNAGAAPISVFIVVDSYYGDAFTFNLTVAGI